MVVFSQLLFRFPAKVEYNELMIDVACAVEYLHHGLSTPVLHCDLKPSNILLDDDMVAHVSDFGISKLLEQGQSKTITDTMPTIGYIARGNYLF